MSEHDPCSCDRVTCCDVSLSRPLLGWLYVSFDNSRSCACHHTHSDRSVYKLKMHVFTYGLIEIMLLLDWVANSRVAKQIEIHVNKHRIPFDSRSSDTNRLFKLIVVHVFCTVMLPYLWLIHFFHCLNVCCAHCCTVQTDQQRNRHVNTSATSRRADSLRFRSD